MQINLGELSYSNFALTAPKTKWNSFDFRGSPWGRWHPDQLAKEQAEDPRLLDKLLAAYKKDYGQYGSYRNKSIDQSCMRDGRNGFDLIVAFKDGTYVNLNSSLAGIVFNDVSRQPSGIRGEDLLTRFDLSDRQLIEYSFIWGNDCVSLC